MDEAVLSEMKPGQVYQWWSRDNGVETTAELLVLKTWKKTAKVLVLANNLPVSFWPPKSGTFNIKKTDLEGCRRIA